MAITIGLDFGTHQTKICIENSDDTHHKTYEFWRWEDGSYAMPSVVQINKDHTLMYGNIEIQDALIAPIKKRVNKPIEPKISSAPSPPSLEEPKEPVPLTMPVHIFKDELGNTISIPYSDLYGIKPYPISEKSKILLEKWEEKCEKIKYGYKKQMKKYKKLKIKYHPHKPVFPKRPAVEYDKDNIPEGYIATEYQIKKYNEWQEKNKCLKEQYHIASDNYIKAQTTYIEQYDKWLNQKDFLLKKYADARSEYENSLVEYPHVYRYFKQATFSSRPWDYELNYEVLSILYLANIIFKLEQRFGTDFSIQMGIPVGESRYKELKIRATGILIQAYRLVEDVFKNDYNRFKKTSIEELLKLIPPFEFTDNLKTEYGIRIIPEAYSALMAVTENKRISNGMSILLDVGGGTTDISFFVLDEFGKPHIYFYESISKGLNFFLEYNDNSIDFTRKKELEELHPKDFNTALKYYIDNLNRIINSLIKTLHADTIMRGFPKNAFIDALTNRPIIYTGGGCYDKRLRNKISYFTDIYYLDKNILGLRNIIAESEINIPYSLLATSYGLSISLADDNIKISSHEDLFANIKISDEKRYDKKDYGLMDDD